MHMDSRTIGKKLADAARLPGWAVCVFGSETPPAGSVALSEVDRCIARTVYKISTGEDTPPVYFGADSKAGICPGGQGWCGVTKIPPMIAYFVSTGRPDYRGGMAEHLKPDPAAAERFFAGPGALALPFPYLNVAGCDQEMGDRDILSFVLIGNAESIRNLGGLAQYAFDEVFTNIVMPSGPVCASMITYAAGISEKAPRDTAFIGPVDPTGNAWLPPGMMSLAIPFRMAVKMAEGIEGSFLGKRPEVAFPVKRLGKDEKASHT